MKQSSIFRMCIAVLSLALCAFASAAAPPLAADSAIVQAQVATQPASSFDLVAIGAAIASQPVFAVAAVELGERLCPPAKKLTDKRAPKMAGIYAEVQGSARHMLGEPGIVA